MAKVGAQRAAELTGVSKSTVQRAMNANKLAYTLDVHGRRVIDVTELERVFGLKKQGPVTAAVAAPVTPVAENPIDEELKKATDMIEIEKLRLRVRMLEDQGDMLKAQIEDLKVQRDQWQKQAEQILTASLYSQRQADDYKAQLKEHQRREMIRRQQAEEMRRARDAETPPRRPGPITAARQRRYMDMNEPQNDQNALTQMTGHVSAAVNAAAINIQDLWQKVKGGAAAA